MMLYQLILIILYILLNIYQIKQIKDKTFFDDDNSVLGGLWLMSIIMFIGYIMVEYIPWTLKLF